MTCKCNGCGGEFTTVAGILAYGTLECESPSTHDGVWADYTKTLCPRCQHVLKDILISSDLSDHWHKYEWSLMNEDAYMEPYDGE